MPSFDVNAMRQRATQIFSGFTTGQKTMLGLAGVGVILGSLLMTRMSGGAPYSTLYANLPSSDAAAVTQALQSTGVKYQLADGGATIKVPQKDVYQLRLDLSSRGLPADGSPGYSLLDKQGITTSEFRQRVDYQRAIEGELARTVKSIDGVDGATVHVVMPAQDLFSDDAPKPSASVLVKTRAGVQLSSQQTQAIVHLVAASVEGLTPDNVTLADANGRVLAAPGEDGVAMTDTRDEQTRSFENSLSKSIQTMVSRVTGDGRAEVRVKAELDYDKTSTVTEKYDDPTKAVTLAEKSSKESYVGQPGSSAAGTLGANGINAGSTSNTPICSSTPATTVAGSTATTVPCTPASQVAPTGANGTASGSGNNYLKEDVQRDYGLGKTTQRVDAASGKVKRLSVAVLLDRNTKVSSSQLQALVSAAAGLDPTRGDTISIAQLPFDTTAADAAAKEMADQKSAHSRDQLYGMAQGVGLLLLVLVALLLAYRSARKSVTRIPVSLPDSMGELTAGERAMGELPEGDLLDLGMSQADSRALELALVGGRANDSDIAHLIERQPEAVAQTLRGWLADRRG